MWIVYMLLCRDNSIYTGITTDLTRRMSEHNGAASGGARYTLAKRPVRVVYSKVVETRSEALKQEAKIKKLTHNQKRQLYEI